MLTTTIILIQSILESIGDDQRLNYTMAGEIRKKFIYDSKNDEGISRSYIFGYEKDNPSYEFLKTRIFNEESDNSFPIQETIYTHNLEFAKQYFLDRLKNLKIEDIEIIYKKITQHFLFNIYSISNDIDVFVAFETMNNRGKPLSHLELLKNRLIYLSTKFDAEDYEKKKLRHSINETWKSVYHFLGKNKLNPLNDDIFLRNHFILQFGHTLLNDKDIRLRSLRIKHSNFCEQYLLEEKFSAKNIQKHRLENFDNDENSGNKENLTISDIYSYIKSLKESVEMWYQLLNPSDSSFSNDIKFWLEKLNRFEILPIAPLIMLFFQKESDEKKRIDLLQILEKFIFFMSLARYRYYMDFDEDILLELPIQIGQGKISSEKIIQDIRQKYEEGRHNKELMKDIKNYFRKNGFYNWKAIKYFLYEYDLHLKERSKFFRDKIDWDIYKEDSRDYYTIEHIYPQRPRKSCWTDKFNHYSPKQKSCLRHSLGNLLPLSKPKKLKFSE